MILSTRFDIFCVLHELLHIHHMVFVIGFICRRSCPIIQSMGSESVSINVFISDLGQSHLTFYCKKWLLTFFFLYYWLAKLSFELAFYIVENIFQGACRQHHKNIQLRWALLVIAYCSFKALNQVGVFDMYYRFKQN